jgi:hypothetical protein
MLISLGLPSGLVLASGPKKTYVLRITSQTAMEGSRGKLAENGTDAVRARVEAALSEARQRRERGDVHGARELALSILAIGEEHIDARQLMAAVELATPPRPPRPRAAVPEHEHEAAPPPPPPPPAPVRDRPQVVVLGAPPPGKERAGAKKPGGPRPLAELAGPLPWAPSEAPPERPHHRRLTLAVGLVIAAVAIVATAAVLLLRTEAPPDTVARAPEAVPSPPAPVEPPAASVVPAPEPVASAAPPPTTAPAAAAELARNEKAARRAAENAQREVQAARLAAEEARAPELSAALFKQARQLDDEAGRLVRRERWVDVLERRREATAAYRRALDQARLEQGRLLVQDAKARAVAAGAERLSPDRLKEATAGITRAQVLREHGDVEAALKEYQFAASAAEQARRSAVEAAVSTPPPTTAAPAPPARTPEADRQEILGVVRRYAAAMEAKDLAGLRALWPAMGEAQAGKIRASFEFARELRVQFEVTSVHVEDRTAIVLARRRDVIVTTDGQALTSERPATITLARGEAWSIASIQ